MSVMESKAEKLVFALFVIGLLSSLFVFVHPWYDWTNDGSTYLITARSMFETRSRSVRITSAKCAGVA